MSGGAIEGEFDAPEGEPVYPAGSGARLRDRLRPGVLAAIAFGAAAGGLARAGIQRGLPLDPGRFPWAVLIINVSGAFLIGAFLATPALLPPGASRLRALTTTGFCGGFTTWSTFMVGTDQLIARGCIGIAIGYVAASVVAGLLATVAGAATVERLASATRRAA